MDKRFTSDELHKLRNDICISWLIRSELQLPSKISDGIFRFLCPVCNEFQTATNPATNLARCFRCEKNFNPIDMVMVVRKLSFRSSVFYLKQLRKSKTDKLNQLIAGIGHPLPGVQNDAS